MSTVQNILDKKGTFVALKNRDDSVFDATKEMVEKRIGSVVVCDGNMVVGIFTERDVLCRIIAEQRDPVTTTLGEVMTTPVACCVPETSFEELRGVMTDKRIRHIPVVKDNALLGIITSGDIIALEKAKRLETIKYLKEYIYGPYQDSSTE